ncbi:MAG TPA: hypothetical protein VMX79_08010 [bacterium]|nr:hypothetical protein [bacterium]
MTTSALTLPPGIPEEYKKGIVEALGPWAGDERLEGILLLGRARGFRYYAPGADVVVVTASGDAVGRRGLRAVCGRTWLRVRVTSRRVFLDELTTGPVTPFKLALREAFVARDRRGRLADALRALEPVLNHGLPRARLAAAAEVAAALRSSDVALAAAGSYDAAEALARATVKLAELELLNDGVWPSLECPLAAAAGGDARRLYASIWRARDDVSKLNRVAAEAAALFRRLLPAASASVFDFLIKRGGSALTASVIEALDLGNVADIDLVLAALDAYGLVKVGREERPVPGLAGLTYSEPVLTLP